CLSSSLFAMATEEKLLPGNESKTVLESLPLEILLRIVSDLGFRDRFALRETSDILENVISSLAKSTLESLPLHVLLRIISHLGIRDRFNLRA
ncbi:hypothetical protein PFISCL1PPCAC_29070, partial [Pristionchus fissidentatus]